MRIAFGSTWLEPGSLGAGHGRELLRLLRTLRDHPSLREAAQAAGVSYRFAWGLLAAAARDFGTPLAELRRGRGAALTEAGLRLLALDDKIGARLAPLFERLSAEYQPELERVATAGKTAFVVHASHDLALGILRELAAGHGIALDLNFQGSAACLEDLARRRCEIAGFHTTDALGGGFGPLRPDRHCAVLFALREQGLIVRPGARVSSLRDLARKTVRFINRQKGSGTRDLLDGLLAREKIAPASIRGYADEEYTHLAVAATVASGHADAGFGIRAAAVQYGLGFVPIATERYCLATTKSIAESAAFARVLALIGSRAFRKRAATLAGYDVSKSGTPVDLPGRPPQK